MGMPCEVNSLLKLKPSQGYPADLTIGTTHQVTKDGYRLFPLDVPILLVNDDWVANADIVITRLVWETGMTHLEFRIDRIYPTPIPVKG